MPRINRLARTRSRSRMWLPALALAAVAAVGCGGDDGGDTNGDAADSGSAGGGAALEVVAGDMYFEPTELSADAGEIEVTLVNEGAAVHNFVVEEADDTTVVEVTGGQTGSGTIELEAGDYTFYCSIPGHREAGMEGSLTVG